MARTQKLTPKQARFVAEYLVDLNATQAAVRAGYSRKTATWIGPQLLGKTHVAQAIERAQEKRALRVEITQDEIIRDIMEIRDRCMQRAPVVDMRGRQVQDEEGNNLWAFNSRDALKALELLGKHLGMFVDRSKVEVEGHVEVVSDEAVAAILASPDGPRLLAELHARAVAGGVEGPGED